MTTPRRRRRLRLTPGSTPFVLFGMAILANEFVLAHRPPNPYAVGAGLLLMGAIPIDVVERWVRRSVLADGEDEPEEPEP